MASAITMALVFGLVVLLGGNPSRADYTSSTAGINGEANGATARSVAVPADEQPPADPADLPSLGLQFHGTWSFYTPAKREAVLDKIEQSGAKWVRLDVSWAMIQPTPGAFDPDFGVPLVDSVMDELRQRGLKVLVMFWLSPDWANKGGGQYQSPTNPQDYAAALGWAVRRWGDVVDAWEIWNEPNLESFYLGTNPVTYTNLLCDSYAAVKRNDAQGLVVFGGLMYNDYEWLQKAYDAGAKDCFDVLAVHSYEAPADAPPSLADTHEVWNMIRLDDVRQTMLDEHDAKPIWVTEFGWSVHDNTDKTAPWRRGVTEAQQATYATAWLSLLAHRFPYVKLAFWYKDVVNPQGTDMHQEGYAMLREDLSPRPVFAAFQHLYGVS